MTAPEETLAALARTTLDKFQTDDQTKLLNVIDRLRSQGVDGLLKDGLPQLIVCGDQSSGKSSVLEALTRVRFPIKTDVCTTFATELVLRRTAITRIATKIKPGPSRKGEDKTRLEQFQIAFSSFDQFPVLIESARDCMEANTNASANTMFDDILQVEINSPDLNPLTIVDLPGIIQHDQQSNKNVELVEKLVRSYMKQKNSIILAIVSAQNDISNQAVLKYVKEIVNDGRRTLGIVTKPDTLESGSDMERKYLELPKNKEIPLEYGWYVVKNRNFKTRDITNEERDTQEKQFFEGSAWAGLRNSGAILGIDALRKKLSVVLLNHIRSQLPSILKTLSHDIEETESQLKKLGKPRSTTTDQQDYLISVSERFGQLTDAALRGDYHSDPFFNTLSSPEGQERKKRLRATVRNLNEEFADLMLEKGQKWKIFHDTELFKMGPASQTEGPRAITRSVFIEEVVIGLARDNRGQELDGTPNPLLVGYLFRQQSEPWEEIAKRHLQNVTTAVKEFLDLTFDHLTADERTCDKLLAKLIDPIIDARKKHVMSKLQELLTPYKDYEPINIDPQFSRTVQALTDKRASEEAVKNLQRHFGKDKQNPFAEKYTSELMDVALTAEPDTSDKLGCSASIDRMEAYYKTAIILFINNVASLAVEQCLLAGLGKIFSPTSIRKISQEKLEAIAGESQDTKVERTRLTTKLKELEAGRNTILEESPRETLRNMHSINGTPNSKSASPVTKKPFNATKPTIFESLAKSPYKTEPLKPFTWEPGTLFGKATTNTAQGPIFPLPAMNAPTKGPVDFSAPPPKPSNPLFGGIQAKDPKGSSVVESPGSASKPSGSSLFGAASSSPAPSTVKLSASNSPLAGSKGTGFGYSAPSPPKPGTHLAGT